MPRSVIVLCVCGLACLGKGPISQLPRPDYERLDSDPEWLAYAAQFHGHLGPWAAAGTRLGMAAVREVGATGYFDVEVVCEGPFVKPPNSCFLDGLQVSTGATLGKRNLHWAGDPTDDIVVRVRNTRTGARAEICPTGRLMEILATLKPRAKVAESAEHADDHAVEALARTIAALPDREILVVTRQENVGLR